MTSVNNKPLAESPNFVTRTKYDDLRWRWQTSRFKRALTSSAPDDEFLELKRIVTHNATYLQRIADMIDTVLRVAVIGWNEVVRR